MSRSGQNNIYVLILVLSIIGAILFIFTEFGGYTAYYSYSVNIESVFRNPDLLLYAPVYVFTAFLFLINILLPIIELKNVKLSLPLTPAQLGFYTSIIILIITAASGVIFAVRLSNAWDWWFNSGFYAGIIGGILLPILYRISMKNPHQATPPDLPPPPPP